MVILFSTISCRKVEVSREAQTEKPNHELSPCPQHTEQHPGQSYCRQLIMEDKSQSPLNPRQAFKRMQGLDVCNGLDISTFFSAWFCGAKMADIRLGNAAEFLAYAFFYRSM